VGDIKQSLYSWRGGDPALFNEVRERYSDGVEVRTLARSFRSGPGVLAAVNHVFGDDLALRAHLPAQAVDLWEWEEHKPSGRTAALGGYACFAHPSVGEAEATDVYALALGILEEVRPLERGLSCAILCENRAAIAGVVDYLRAHGVTNVSGGARPKIATDNPVTTALLALFKAAAYPGDTFAWMHVAMSPVGHLPGVVGESREQVLSGVLTEIHKLGFEGVLRSWIGRLDAAGAVPGAFSQHRLRALCECARTFDVSGDRSVTAFLRYVTGVTTSEPPARGAIQVMTIHASKGLGFDVVILPQLEGKNLKTLRGGLAVGDGWVSELPRKEFRELDPVFSSYVRGGEAEAAYESLCRLYVAMTRAKRALYMLSKPRAKTSVALNFLSLLDDVLSGEGRGTHFSEAGAEVRWEHGERDWAEAVPVAGPGGVGEGRRAGASLPPGIGARRLRRRTPSGAETHTVTGEQLFSGAGAGARAFGTAVHAFFEQMIWADSEVAPAGSEIEKRARDEVVRCLKKREVVKLLSRPESAAETELWNEKSFEAVLDGEWVTGTFDRVVLEKDLMGYVRATIIDFKTDRTGGREELERRAGGYQPQLNLYRSVVCQLTGLPPEAVKCVLLFTEKGIVWTY